VAAVPLRLNGTRLGALDIYCRGPHVWTTEKVETAELRQNQAPLRQVAEAVVDLALRP
jgi:hypothetical protein